MPEIRNFEQAIEAGEMPIIEKAFARPSRFRESLELMGISLGPEEPIGVLDNRTIELELRNMGIPPRFIRQASRGIMSDIRNGKYPRNLFPVGSVVSIEPDKPNKPTFFRRSDVPPKIAEQRLTAYQTLLREEAERSEREKVFQTAASEAERTRPSTATIRTISTFNLEEYRMRVQELREGITGRQIVEEIPHDVKGRIESIGRIIQLEDARKILASGLTEQQFATLIMNVRSQFIARINADSQKHLEMSKAMLRRITERIKQPGSDVDMPIYLPRDIAETVFYQLVDLNNNPNIQVEIDFAQSPIPESAPFPRFLANIWGGRYDEDVLGVRLDQIKQVYPEIGEAIETALSYNNSAGVFRNLRSGGNLNIGDKEIKKAEIDQSLAPIILNDQLLAQAIFADILGEMYPMPYHHVLVGESREMSLYILRYLAENFSLNQIKGALNPKVTGKEIPQIDTLNRQIGVLDSRLAEVVGKDKQAVQRRQALQKEKERLIRRLQGFERQRKVNVSLREVVKQMLFSRIPQDEPDPGDFANGENSLGYKRALARFELTREAKPDQKEPNPDDFILEDQSAGYNEEYSLHQAFLTLTPAGWVMGRSNTGSRERRARTVLAQLAEPAILTAGIIPY